jgi:hypothetical protein
MMTEDLSFLFNDFGSDVVFGLFSFQGILDRPDSQSGMMINTDYQLTIKTTDLSTMEEGSSLTVDAISYEVRKIEAIGDGKLTRLSLGKI